ncbi:unnamed protein product [Nezara viridula]|uniref:Uncharacterized protein n=1 Tax=Nezara viridula TaxID=85310 RepID=A0A9P0E827_NEZVI|nr:unnamed protein product [Nezara viridula]
MDLLEKKVAWRYSEEPSIDPLEENSRRSTETSAEISKLSVITEEDKGTAGGTGVPPKPKFSGAQRREYKRMKRLKAKYETELPVTAAPVRAWASHGAQQVLARELDACGEKGLKRRGWYNFLCSSGWGQ